MRQTKLTSVRLTMLSLQVIQLLSDRLGLSQSALIELALRRLAEQEGIGYGASEKRNS